MKFQSFVRNEKRIVKHTFAGCELLTYQRGGVNWANWSALRESHEGSHEEGSSVWIARYPYLTHDREFALIPARTKG